VVGHALFGFDLLGKAADVSRAFTEALRITNDRLYSFVYLPPSIPTPRNVRFSRAMRVLDGVVHEIIEARRAAPSQADMLGMFMEARDSESGEGLCDEELRDVVMTMVLAGHETTANALSWAFYLLSSAPEVAGRLYEESRAALGGGPATLNALPHLGFAAQVCQEAMRLYPPAWIFGREAIEEDVFGQFKIPANAALVVSPWLLHRDPRWWEDPEEFKPSRFTSEAVEARPKYSYVPFAAGPRMCIGNNFAMMEMQVVLGMVAARYRLELVPGRPVEVEPSVTLRPRSGIWMSVRPQAATRAASETGPSPAAASARASNHAAP
jgi:cytochrome P450